MHEGRWPRTAKAAADAAANGTGEESGRRTMSDEHKAALASGRESGRAVKAYLEALDEQNKPKKRGRQRTAEQIKAKLADIGAQMAVADPLQKLVLASQEIALEKELEAKENEAAPVDLSELEAGFIKYGKVYAANKGIVYGRGSTCTCRRRSSAPPASQDLER